MGLKMNRKAPKEGIRIETNQKWKIWHDLPPKDKYCWILLNQNENIILLRSEKSNQNNQLFECFILLILDTAKHIKMTLKSPKMT